VTRAEAIKKLFSQNGTEAMFGAENARKNRELVAKRKAAKARRQGKRAAA